MRLRRRGALGLAAVLACAVLCGCAPRPDRYVEDRGRDFADCWDGGIGYGVPAYLRVKLTDLLVLGAGYGQTETVGWRGRYSGPPGLSAEEQWGIPLVRCVEEVYSEDHFRLEVETWGPCFTKRWYPEGEDRRLGTDAADYGWLGVSLTAGVAGHVGLNLLELGDFLAGLFLFDPLADDEWSYAISP